MSLRISGKNMDVGDTLRQRIEDTIEEAVGKYFDGGYDGRITVEKEGNRFNSDCVVHLDTGVVLRATATNPDPRSSFDQAAERIEKRLRRYKRKLKDHHAVARSARDEDVSYTVMQSLENLEEVSDDFNPTVVAETTINIPLITVAAAVMRLDMADNPVIVFRNAGSDLINVVYRRNDGNIGWIDPSRDNDGE